MAGVAQVAGYVSLVCRALDRADWCGSEALVFAGVTRTTCPEEGSVRSPRVSLAMSMLLASSFLRLGFSATVLSRSGLKRRLLPIDGVVLNGRVAEMFGNGLMDSSL